MYILKPQTCLPLRLLYPGDTEFPTNLASSAHCPERLFYRGTLEPTDTAAVALVGSRNCSDQGREAAFSLASDLASSGVCVVSGLALGIDGAAHRGALAAGGRTIAVLGTGLDRIRPLEHLELSNDIADSGAVVSQFAPCFTGYHRGRNYLMRNAVIAGLSQVLVVVEARARSGSLSAVRWAIEQGRPVGLLSSLVESQDWARAMVENDQAFQVDAAEDILKRLKF